MLKIEAVFEAEAYFGSVFSSGLDTAVNRWAALNFFYIFAPTHIT
jgi:hypothetical protein